MSTWIDFRELRQKLKFEQVLRYYNVQGARKGGQQVGRCPLPTHGSRSQPDSFSANLERGIFRCFGCRAQGNLLEFASLMEGQDPRDGRSLRTVALKLQAALMEEQGPNVPQTQSSRSVIVSAGPKVAVINAPLDFELKGLDQDHPYLLQKGFNPETIRHFGLGVAIRGSLKGMLAIPLHNADGKLVGYAGHPVDGSADILTAPAYRLPEAREHKGVRYEFRGDRLVYNAHRVRKPIEDLVVVGNMSSVWWLHQCGTRTVVALIGGALGEREVEVLSNLVALNGRIWSVGERGLFWGAGGNPVDTRAISVRPG